MKFRVKIVETLSKSFDVEGQTEEEALARVSKKHRDGEIVVESDNGVDVSFLVQPITEYVVAVTETLRKIVAVEAVTADDAIDLIKCKYRAGEVVLDNSDSVGVDFSVCP